MTLFYRCFAHSVYWASKLLYGLEVTGTENIPRSGSFILVSNHRSWMDPPLLVAAARLREVAFMAKEELFEKAGVGPLITWLHAFPVSRKGFDRGALRIAIDRLKTGRAIGIFPEGKRSDTYQMLEWRPGLALLVRQSGAPILPAAILESRETFEVGKWSFRNRRLRIHFGPLIETSDDTSSREISDRQADRAQAAVLGLLNGA